ncbi:hypothetical protein [Amycolatopsis sp. CA-126428]|nr:hypothetical protein [Amycolatopsis sp. CA-126428]
MRPAARLTWSPSVGRQVTALLSAEARASGAALTTEGHEVTAARRLGRRS